MKRLWLWVTAVVLLLAAVIFYLFFEIQEEPNIQWYRTYDFQDKEPNGLYVFGEITKKYFKSEEVEFVESIEETADLNDAAVIFISKSKYDNRREDRTLKNYLERGARVLYLTHRLETDLLDSLVDDYTTKTEITDTLVLSFKEGENHEKYKFALFENNLEKSVNHTLEGYSEIDNSESESSISTLGDSITLFSYFDMSSGDIFVHQMPELFFNKSYRNDDMFEYTQKVLSLLKRDKIFLTTGTLNIQKNSRSHPLEFIMNNPSLKAAYLLLMATLLIYAIFGGKRRQRIIPILKKKENTSLQYIDTVSQLFHQQEQHDKLVRHMSEVFYHTMKKKYFVNKDDPEFVEVLSKKSKLPHDLLSFVVNRFQNQEDNYSFSQDQLIALYDRLEEIYRNINTKNKSS